MSSQPPPVLTELKLNAAIKKIVNSAVERGKTISVAYVDELGKPHLSFRGSVQVYGDAQLAIWVRDAKGGILKAVGKNPNLVLLYGDLDPATKAFMTFHGRGRVDNSDAVRRTVYGNSPKVEQDLDKDQGGIPLIIDLDSVDGFVTGVGVLKMRR